MAMRKKKQQFRHTLHVPVCLSSMHARTQPIPVYKYNCYLIHVMFMFVSRQIEEPVASERHAMIRKHHLAARHASARVARIAITTVVLLRNQRGVRSDVDETSVQPGSKLSRYTSTCSGQETIARVCRSWFLIVVAGVRYVVRANIYVRCVCSRKQQCRWLCSSVHDVILCTSRI